MLTLSRLPFGKRSPSHVWSPALLCPPSLWWVHFVVSYVGRVAVCLDVGVWGGGEFCDFARGGVVAEVRGRQTRGWHRCEPRCWSYRVGSEGGAVLVWVEVSVLYFLFSFAEVISGCGFLVENFLYE